MSKANIIRNFANKIATSDGIKIMDPVISEEISFIPLVKEEVPKNERDYLTLTEALNENACKIKDMGNDVAHILFKNNGMVSILIEEGEIFRGVGTQDRINVGTIMVEPEQEVKIPVKCVYAPHHLSTGAAFGYGGKASRGMLNTLRTMKFANATQNIPASAVDQSQVWNKVSEENEAAALYDNPKYMENIDKRKERAKSRIFNLEFPENTIGLVIVDQQGKIKGVEIHRTPHSFEVRKEGIFESIESEINWKKTGKGAHKEAKKVAMDLFSKISKIEEGKDVKDQVEIDGLVINTDELTGEAYTATFYSDHCLECGKSKPRKKICPHCGHTEDDDDEVAYMSFY